MSFPIFIFILIGLILSVFIAFLIYSMMNPSVSNDPSLIVTKFLSFLNQRQSIRSDYLIEKGKRLKRIQEEKDKLEFMEKAQQQANQAHTKTPKVPDKDIIVDTEIRCKFCKSTHFHCEKNGWSVGPFIFLLIVGVPLAIISTIWANNEVPAGIISSIVILLGFILGFMDSKQIYITCISCGRLF